MIKSDFLTKSKLLAKLSSRLSFFLLKARLAFIKLRQVFIKIPIFHHFDLKYYIYIKIDIFDYIISEIYI